MFQHKAMDAKIFFSVLEVVTIVFLVSENAEGRKVMVFSKPFFSSDIKNSQTFKDQTITTRSECPSAYTKSFNGSRYRFVDPCQGLNRSAAQSDCEEDSSHLVFIDTEEENNFLVREASRDTMYWIGLFSPKRHLFWDNGNQVTFVNLDGRKEDTFNDSTGCYKMSNTNGRYWLDKPCDEELGFICEYELGSECPDNSAECLNNSRYKFVNDFSASRFTAQSKCENDSSHLVFIESKEENDFLVGKAQNGIEYWIGLHDRPQLFWDNGNRVTFTNMDKEVKNTFNGRSGCYRMSSRDTRLWVDKPCRRKYSYICEYNGSECAPGYKPFEGSCYKFVDPSQNATRFDAQSHCERNSSHLVLIETKEENDFLIKQASLGTKYWIGLFSPERHLFWDNGNQVTFTNFDRKNEDTFNDGKGCYKMSDSEERFWVENSCETEYAFICEYEGPTCLDNTTASFNNSCYNFVNDVPESRVSAQLKCKYNSSHLVVIESKEENDFLIRKAQNGTEYWIGLHDRPQLFWDDGKEVSYANIDAGQDRTFNDRTGCYKMSDHEGGHIWFDRPCDDIFGYICEYEG